MNAREMEWEPALTQQHTCATHTPIPQVLPHWFLGKEVEDILPREGPPLVGGLKELRPALT